MLALREEARRGLAAVIGVDAELVALDRLDDPRLRDRARRSRARPPSDEVVTTDQEHFGLIGPLHATGARVVVTDADEDAILAAVTPRTRLDRDVARPLDDGPAARPRSACARERRAGARRRRAVGAARSRSTPARSTSTRSRRRSGCARPSRPAGSTCAIPTAARRDAVRTSPQASYEPTGAFVAEGGRARASTPAGSASPALAGSSPRSRRIPSGATSARPRLAARCRELLAPHVEVVTPPGHSTLVSFRPHGDPTSSSRRSTRAA